MAHKMLPSRHGKKLAIIVYVMQTALILPFDLRSRDAVAENKFQIITHRKGMTLSPCIAALSICSYWSMIENECRFNRAGYTVSFESFASQSMYMCSLF